MNKQDSSLENTKIIEHMLKLGLVLGLAKKYTSDEKSL